jgi:hypothetical protein
MTDLPKGGRGKKVPYETTTVRIPIAIKDQVEDMANRYRTAVIEGSEFTPGDGGCDLNRAVALAKKLLRQKRSAKLTIINLLQVLYNTKLTLKDFE